MAAKKWRQGQFVPKNKGKFIGSKATYRSGLELKFFRFCDNNKNVINNGDTINDISNNLLNNYIKAKKTKNALARFIYLYKIKN